MTSELLRKAASALEKGDDPFSFPFLSENDVSADECMELAILLAVGARIVAGGIEDPGSAAGRVVLLQINAPEWHQATMADLPRLDDAIVSSVEMRSDYGRISPDYDLILSDVEESEDHLDLGTDLTSPVLKAIMLRAREVYKELRDNS